MKKVVLMLALGLFFCNSHFGEAAYYMRADGKASGKSAATSCSSASTAMSVVTHNTQKFAPGDIIYLCDNGGTYKFDPANNNVGEKYHTAINVPSSGMAGKPITYANAPGHKPVIDVSHTINNSSWTAVGGGAYKYNAGYLAAQTFFEDGVPLTKATDSRCSDGNWFWNTSSKPTGQFYYKPTSGTPAVHALEGIMAGSTNSARGINIADKSYITVSGVHFNRCAVGVWIGQLSNYSNVINMTNIIVQNNTFTQCYKAIYGEVKRNGVISHVQMLDNTASYCASGMGLWAPGGAADNGYAQHSEHITITRNQILKIGSINDNLSWANAWGAYYGGNGGYDDGQDHEAISFQDVSDSEVSYNLITAVIPISATPNAYIYSPRAIVLYGHPYTTHPMSNNKIIYNKLEGSFSVGFYIIPEGTDAHPHAGSGNNVIAYNVYAGNTFAGGENIAAKLWGRGNNAREMNYFINNTCISAANTAHAFWYYAGGLWTIRNNIFKTARNGYVNIGKGSKGKGTLIIDHNIYQTGGYFAYNDGSSDSSKTFIQWKALGYDIKDSYCNINPLLDSSGVISAPSSPAIDSGLNLGTAYAGALSPKSVWPKNVIIVNQNNNGRGWEIGAYVYP